MGSYPRLAREFRRLRSEAAKLFPDVEDFALRAEWSAGREGRAFGYCARRKLGSMIVVSPDLEDQPLDRIRGVLMHELGHAVADMSYYHLSTIEARLGGDLPKSVERRADEIASRIFGVTIAYDADDVQTIGLGVSPRPSHLPR